MADQNNEQILRDAHRRSHGGASASAIATHKAKSAVADASLLKIKKINKKFEKKADKNVPLNRSKRKRKIAIPNEQQEPVKKFVTSRRFRSYYPSYN